MKHKRLITLLIGSMSLIGCSNSIQYVDDIDLAYYVHHIDHRVFATTTKIVVSIKPLGTNNVEEYTFSNLIWGDNYYWMGDCSEYKYNDNVFDFFDCSVLYDGIAQGFVTDNFNNCISAIDYYGDSRDERQEGSRYIGRMVTLKGAH